MKRMKLSELTGNEILAQSLMTWDYQIILPEGVVLKKEYISKIEEMGILEVYVKEDQANEIVILKNDIEKTIKNKVNTDKPAYTIISGIILIAMVLISVTYTIKGTYNPFIYFNF